MRVEWGLFCRLKINRQVKQKEVFSKLAFCKHQQNWMLTRIETNNPKSSSSTSPWSENNSHEIHTKRWIFKQISFNYFLISISSSSSFCSFSTTEMNISAVFFVFFLQSSKNVLHRKEPHRKKIFLVKCSRGLELCEINFFSQNR